MITRRSSRKAALISKVDEEILTKKVATNDKKIGAKVSTKQGQSKASSKIKRRQLSKQTEKPIDNLIKSDDDHKNPVKKKLKRNQLKFDFTEQDPIIEHLKEFSNSNAIHQQVTIDAEILDEIALEGLSGITLGRLCRILDAIFPNFDCTKNENCQNYVWSTIVKKYLHYPLGNSVQAFYLDPKKKTQNRLNNSSAPKGVIIDKLIRLPNQTVKRIAKIDSLLFPVQDGHIMGSCASYLSRSDITQDVIEKSENEGPLGSMYSVNDHYGLENVFFVASQALRNRTLLPNWADPNVDIKLREYCALELIGKSRTLGTVFPNDKALGRYRIMLTARGFITQFQETKSSPIEHHLKRFSRGNNELVTRGTIDSSSEEEYNLNQSLWSLCYDPGKLKVDRSTLSMVYDVIAESRDGLTQLDIRRELNLPKFHLRNHLKNLLSLKMIFSRKGKDAEKPFRIYKTTHKSKKKKIKSELAKATGIMASWDETDLRAKKIIGLKRSCFSQAEDSLLILCRITSILIEPKLRLSWCVHKRSVRDILHGELVESHDKTSDACLRRIKYLKRLPNNIMSINELTAELQDDSDITRLIQRNNNIENDDDKLNKLFLQVLKTIRVKIPNLLGITTCPTILNNKELPLDEDEHNYGRERSIEINNHEELKEKYELVDCQSVASISRAPTYEQPKNVVDIKFSNACLVTMAFTLSGCLDPENPNKRAYQWLLEQFYSNYHDKLISSVLSKLNKRSLLTRKCPAQQATIYKPKRKMSLKLNQSVLFLLNRYHSSSLIQLAQPISRLYKVNLIESNEMASIALLTSLCSLSSFNLDLRLKIPTNVVGIDQGNENFKSLCEKANESTREILATFMNRCGESLTVKASTPNTTAPSVSTPASVFIEDQANDVSDEKQEKDCSGVTITANANNKMDDSRRALFLLRHELKAHALDKCGSLSDCLIVQPCNVKFYSEKQLELAKDPLESFLKQARPIDMIVDQHDQQQRQTNWLVKSFRLSKNGDRSDSENRTNSSDNDDNNQDQELNETGASSVESDFEANKIPLQYHARLWKRIDGSVHMLSLFKLIESLLSWIIVFPGVESDLLQREFGHLMPDEHLFEMLTLMESLKLISSYQLKLRDAKPRLLGYWKQSSNETINANKTITYEASPDAYIQYCQLLNYCK